jgi:methanogenic corrinoid protein MtbC1
MRNKPKENELISAIADLREELVLNIVREYLSRNIDPVTLIKECQEGLRIIGERYEKRLYFLSGLVMGGEILREVTDLIKPLVTYQNLKHKRGKVLIGTVAGDIHDLGKNIVIMLLNCHNFEVTDIGIDVPPEIFLKQAREIQPDIIGLSGLITSAYDSMRDTVKLLHKGGCQSPIIIGGSLLNAEAFNYIGADYWVTDASAGLEICNNLISKPK